MNHFINAKTTSIVFASIWLVFAIQFATLKSKIENSILGGFVAWRWISAFSSIGSFIAATLDILDGRFDDVLSI